MLVCPKCNCEYEEGYTTCSDCQCELIKKQEKEESTSESGNPRIKKIVSYVLILSFFLFGSILCFIGLAKGLDIASSLSRPEGAMGWTIPDKLVLACTYTPVIIGGSFILLSICLSTVLFIKWINISD